MIATREHDMLDQELDQRQIILAMVNSGVGTVYLLLAYGWAVPWQGWLWLGVMSAIQIVRLGFWYVRWQPTQSSDASLSHSRQRIADHLNLYGFSLASGIVWGLIVILPTSGAAEPQIVVQAFVLAGLCSAAAVALSLSLKAFAAFVIPTVLPFILVNALAEDAMRQQFGWVAGLFLLAMGYFGWRIHKLLRHSLDLAKHNSDLAQDLAQARQALQQRVDRQENEIGSLLDIVPAFVWIARDGHGKTLNVSRHAKDRLDEQQDHPGDLLTETLGRQFIEQVLDGNPANDLQTSCRSARGETIELAVNAAPIKDADKGVVGAVAVGLDVTRFRALTRALSLSEARFRDFANSASDWLWETDAEHRFTWISPNVEARVGVSREWHYGKPRISVMNGQTDPAAIAEHLAQIESHQPFRDFEYNRTGPTENNWLQISGVPVFGENGAFRGYRGVGRDITEQRNALAIAKHLATHDSLTDLANRRGFQDRLAELGDAAINSGQGLGMLLIDVDRFKYVNDTYGHLSGDRFLIGLGQRIARLVGETSAVGRIGGDEFAVLLPGCRNPQDLANSAQALVDAMDEPLTADKHLVFPSISVGGAHMPTHTQNTDSLMLLADRALYRAKNEGRNRFCLYDSRLDRVFGETSQLSRQLADALGQNQFELYYQPQISLRTGRIIGAEALLRWNHPQEGVLAPGRFLALAESGGMMTAIGRWIIQQACEQTAIWRKSGSNLRVSINLAQSQITDLNTVHHIDSMLSRYKLSPCDLEFEITETVVMDSISSGAFESLASFAKRSLRIALDDFGTGHSSLAYLRQLPAHTIKIDRSFVQAIGDRGDSDRIVEAIIGLGHTLGKTVLGEGIETVSQSRFLKDNNCEIAQGFLYSRPVQAEKFDPLTVYAA